MASPEPGCAELGRPSREKKKERNQQFDLVVAVHAAEYSAIERRGHIPPAPAHRLQVTLEHASFSEEKYLPAARAAPRHPVS